MVFDSAGQPGKVSGDNVRDFLCDLLQVAQHCLKLRPFTHCLLRVDSPSSVKTLSSSSPACSPTSPHFLACLAMLVADLVGRFICSVTYFLSCFVCRKVELVQHSIEILSGEAPLERFGDTFVMPLEREQAFC